MRVIWTEPALDGIDRAYEYLVDFNPLAVAKIADGLRAAGDSLEYFPQRGRSIPETNMRELVTAYPYIIRYRIALDAVIILRVRHASRRPTAPDQANARLILPQSSIACSCPGRIENTI